MYVKIAHGSEAKAGVPDQVVTPNETREALKEMIRDIIRKSWNSTLLIKGRERLTRRRAIKALWAEVRFADFDPKTGPTIDLT